ncbi:hypothetical protein GALMADRAFT_63553 [Galerina marginata CBS 339.88]|uniref:Terpene synthase n=1 Tax=Galerina marginata (strain CBS 339.88) TaxID=685588 RepID=A0A067T917_GALM3|nr:hypothetical protein GALMADRAFT_63553 [Galerina marginata CBS 339.88]
MTTSLTFRLPRLDDTFAVFPDKGVNPHFSECRRQSREWVDKYTEIAFGPKMCAFLRNCNLELVAAYAYPDAKPDGLRAAMDYLNIAWVFDEFTDDLSGKEAIQAAAVATRTLRDRDFDDGSWVCHILTDYRLNHIDKFGSNVALRFIDHLCQSFGQTGAEAELREKNQVLNLDSYISLRRSTVAVRVVFDLVEYCLGLNLPQYVHEDPVFISAYLAAVDVIAWTNDLASYDMEQAKGHSGANIVTVVMKSKGINLQSAVDFIAGYCECLTQQFICAKADLASRTDPVFSKDSVRCLDAFGDWVRGNDEWNFVTERYFGQRNTLVKETRVVELRKPFEDVVLSTE